MEFVEVVVAVDLAVSVRLAPPACVPRVRIVLDGDIADTDVARGPRGCQVSKEEAARAVADASEQPWPVWTFERPPPWMGSLQRDLRTSTLWTPPPPPPRTAASTSPVVNVGRAFDPVNPAAWAIPPATSAGCAPITLCGRVPLSLYVTDREVIAARMWNGGAYLTANAVVDPAAEGCRRRLVAMAVDLATNHPWGPWDLDG